MINHTTAAHTAAATATGRPQPSPERRVLVFNAAQHQTKSLRDHAARDVLAIVDSPTHARVVTLTISRPTPVVSRRLPSSSSSPVVVDV
jgi:hypothetical protein